MSTLIERAMQRKVEAEHRRDAAKRKLDAAQFELEIATTEAAEWALFLDKAKILGAELSPEPSSASVPHDPTVTPDRVSVRADSWAGKCAKLIQDNGPQSLKSLVAELVKTETVDDVEKFTNSVNSAIWRRKDDLFIKDVNGRYTIRAKEVVYGGE